VDDAAPAGALDTEAAEVVELGLALGEAGEDGWQPFVVRLAVEDGWHLNAAEVRYAELVATGVAAEGAELRAVEYPEGESWAPEGGEEIAVYRGEIEVRGEVKPAGEGAGEAAALVVTWQSCDDHRCLPAVRRRLELR
ncbi:MAG TPA: protein-disulfide reductase DsbD domain-containing protein, partial [Thermoanaerobaculia bacterium]|nr:protein-disulfide reductase DsbD domain-containing protein [Thermoanaerobaculia bacterium]